VILTCGRRDDLTTVAASLYGVLRAFNDTAVAGIFVEAFDGSDGIGCAIMNRLAKACGGVVVHEPRV
jgi:L-threonylcarbamoyladenylate synthase